MALCRKGFHFPGAVKLSAEEYCSGSIMPGKTAEISHKGGSRRHSRQKSAAMD
jgi:hypothetical protein